MAYVRCHDDIGWAVSDDDAAAVGASLCGIEATRAAGDPGAETAARRHQEGSLESRVFGAISALARARRSLLALRAGGRTEVRPAGNRSVLAYRRLGLSDGRIELPPWSFAWVAGT